jgi:hypothetical protein
MMTFDPYYKRSLEQRIVKDADQTEFSAMLKGSVLIDAGLYDDKVSGALDDFIVIDATITERWHSMDIEYDTSSGQVFDEIIRRKKLLGCYYPFTIHGNQIVYNESKSYFYEFCLAISLSSNITKGDNVNFPRTFERMSAVIMKLFLGDNSESIHVGSPRDHEIGTTFVAAMKKVNEITKEWIWNPIADFGQNPQTTGDEGMDFIVWKNSPDKRNGRMFIVGQCACGDDWKDKFNDLNIEKIGKWFQPISYVKPPVRAFTTPYHLSDTNLINAQLEAGIVFNRARLCIIAEQFFESEAILIWRDKIYELSRSVIKQ